MDYVVVREWRAYPVRFAYALWPDVTLYDRQRDILHSVRDCPETYVVAGNMLGKDFIAGLVALWGFLVHDEARVVTTSVKDDHLRILWGEIERFVQTSRVPLIAGQGGHLIVNHHDVKRLRDRPGGKGREEDPISYLRGMVSKLGEGMAGHHARYTLLIGDEASGLDDQVHSFAQGWAKRFLYIGNPNACSNFFYRNVKAGDLPAS